jgi:putative flippase GtrA
VSFGPRDGQKRGIRSRPAPYLAFVLVGAYNTAFAYAVFAALHLLLPGLHYLTVLTITAVLAIANAFVAYRLLVFKVKGHVARDLARFVLTYAAAIALNFLVLPVLVEVLGVEEFRAQAVALLCIAAFSYVAHKNFSFRRSTTPTAS